MPAFTDALRASAPKSRARRRWLFVPYDQLHDGIGPLAHEPPGELGIVLVESRQKAGRRPYHQQKLALVLANLRHFALEQQARGVLVRHVATDGGYADALAPLAKELGPLRVQRPAERELRAELAPLFASGALVEVPHEGWLSTAEDFAAVKGPPWRMDAFYRQVRQRTGVLMERQKPVGGKYSFDAENRKPWRGEPAAPTELVFRPDAITQEVGELVARDFAKHPGELRLDRLPATRKDAERLWQWGLRECLPQFGPYEDAMSVRSSGLFHTRLSQVMNLHRVLPARVLQDVLAADLPLPAAFWGKAPSGMNCLDTVVGDVWREGYSHHITRLMVLGNLATLLGVSPRELTDWFWAAYVDAYDWVVEPNVLAMATYGVGELMTTKPYVAGSAYIDKMSDYCAGCAFDPKSTCPVTRLYWAFLARNSERLEGNQRIAMPLRSCGKRAATERAQDARTLAWARRELGAGRTLRPGGDRS